MPKRPSHWLLISLVLFSLSAWLWHWAERRQTAQRKAAASFGHPILQPLMTNVALDITPRSLRVALGDRFRQESWRTNGMGPGLAGLRLTNAAHTAEQWLRLRTALLLENAWIDTAAGAPASPPPHLRGLDDPGAYLVQHRGVDAAHIMRVFQTLGVKPVSYVPNNAYLVRGDRTVAARLASHPDIQAVLPYEPYYKLRGELLARAVAGAPLGLGDQVYVALFADAADEVRAALQRIGAKVWAEEPSPFGPVLTVEPPPERWLELAVWPGVQLMEIATDRVPANDLGRVRMGVSPTPVSPDNYLGLTGSNVLINVNDSGVDASHPDLQGRMSGATAEALTDTNGHGTHVVGTIAGNGLMSPTVFHASGSPMPAVAGQFRGMAPGVRVYVQSVGLANRPGQADARALVPDAVLQERAAQTNALISNNSWHYAGNTGYDLAAARYDAATRDALPGEPGSQPLLFVFAAGNYGAGNGSGLGGTADSIRSPGTAKNVITVGSLEQPRQITNEVTICRQTDTGTNVIQSCSTNAIWRDETDSDDQVAAVSSRGNTGIGVEGEFGRFKPDVVAPGQWVVSTRSQHWDEQSYYNPTNTYIDDFAGLIIPRGAINRYSVFVPYNAVRLDIELRPHRDSPVPFPNLPIFVRAGDFPGPADVAGTNRVSIPSDVMPALSPRDISWNVGVGNPTARDVTLNLRIRLYTTNDTGNELEVRRQLNEGLGPWYRYESGSSMAAAHVAGTLALIQEFFARYGMKPSPALMKALLINGARSVNAMYDFEVPTLHNYQGWGLVRLPTVLPPALTNGLPPRGGPIMFYDQSVTNALVTGDRHVRQLTLREEARALPLRVTLVWTDPPANPAVGVKLVNDLDLVVTNLDTGQVYFGNDIPGGSDFTQPWRTNELPRMDMVNNVENVFLAPPLGTNYTITVIGRRIHVNALTAHTNHIAQDYALVVSCGDGDLPNAFTISEPVRSGSAVTSLRQTTNTFSSERTPGYAGILLLGERAGANPALLGLTNGLASQWRFYVLTNTHNYTNAAFITFLPHTLSVSRMGVLEESGSNATRLEADIDLYVSRNPALTNLDPIAVATADRSRGRGGTELIVYSNAAPGAVYYVGVKAEDQMAADYGFLGIFSLLPFSTLEDGNQIVRGFPVPAVIPDGSPAAPGVAWIFGVATWPMQVRRVVVTNGLTHQNFGDLVVSLTHNNIFAVLRNHTYPSIPPPLSAWTVYEDHGEGDVSGAQRSDGPGSLRDFTGEEAAGLWVLQALDDALTQTGRVDHFSLRIEPQLLDQTNTWRGIEPFSFRYEVVDVPEDGTNLTICVVTTNAPVELYLRYGDFPTRTQYDYFRLISVPGACLGVDRSMTPPLRAGRYYLGVYNPHPFRVYVQIVARVDRDLLGIRPVLITSNLEQELLDDAVNYAEMTVTNRGRIASLEVGVRIDHPRVSDLAITLVSPRGTRVLLSEARGWTSTAGMGSSYWITNIVPVEYSGGPEAVTNVVDVGINEGSVHIEYNFYGLRDRLKVYYEGVLLADTGLTNGAGVLNISFGPGRSTALTITVNEGGNPEPWTEWWYRLTSVREVHNYLIFTENTSLAAAPIKFLSPPFAPPTNRTVSLLSSFETVPEGWYEPGSVVEGWTIGGSGPVQVVNHAAWTHTGVKFLSLGRGSLRQDLATVPGRNYLLQFVSRAAVPLQGMISWWPGEGNAQDVVSGYNGFYRGAAGTRFTNGVVGTAFGFDGIADAIQVPNQTAFQVTTGMTAEAWVYPTAYGAMRDILTRWGGEGLNDRTFRLSLDSIGRPHFAVSFDGSECIYPCSVYAVDPIPLRTWSHVAGTYDGESIRLYVNGVLVSEVFQPGHLWRGSTDLVIGGQVSLGTLFFPFAGLIDEPALYGRALGAEEIRWIYEAGSRGKCGLATPPIACGFSSLVRLSVDGAITNLIWNTATNWMTNTVSFTAHHPRTTVVLEPGLTGSQIWLDTFVLTEFPSPLYALPEESLRDLTGEEGFGRWQLEIWDMRAGGTNPPSLLRSWQLRIVFLRDFAEPSALVNGQSMTNIAPAGQMTFHTVRVPAWALGATNRLLEASAPVNLWFNQDRVPYGTNSGDRLLLSQGRFGQFILTTQSIPPLVSGATYYLAVENTNAVPVTYSLRVDFNVTPLTNGVPFYGIESPGSGARYFSYVVSPAADSVLFRLSELTANADLVVRRGFTPPTLGEFDYGSFQPGLWDEEVVILTNSWPVPLTPGMWLLGIYNRDTAPASYSLLAMEQSWPNRIVTLTNGVSYADSIGPAETDYYRFVVPADATRAQFDLEGATADVALVARKGWPPATLDNYDYLSANPGSGEESILIFRTSEPVPLTAGEWYVSAVNVTAGETSYRIRATAWPSTGRPVRVVGIRLAEAGLCLTWSALPGARYYVEGMESLDSGQWMAISPTLTASGTNLTWCVPLPSPYHFFRVVDGVRIAP